MEAASAQFSDVLLMGLSRAEICDAHRANTARAVKPLVEFMALQGVDKWDDLGVEHVRAYVAHLKRKGLRADTIRGYINPLRIAWRESRTRFDDEPLKIGSLLPRRSEPVKRYLPLNQLIAVIECARDRGDRAALIGFIAGGLAGLRITEIMRLTPDCLDVRDRTVRVDGVTKNDSSRRIIPVAGMVADALQEHFEYRQEPYRAVTTFSHRMRWCLNQVADDTGDGTFRIIAPKDAGRKTFAEIACDVAREEGTDKDLVRAYLGHAFPAWDMLHRNYSGLVPRPDDLPHVRAKSIERLRDRIVKPLEEKIKQLM